MQSTSESDLPGVKRTNNCELALFYGDGGPDLDRADDLFQTTEAVIAF